jgi:formyltetrahydrofolate deformylase
MIIVIQCKDQVGLVAGITNVLAKEQLNIISLREYVDTAENLFFMRLEIEEAADANMLENKLKSVLPVDVILHINPLPLKKVVVMVTKEYHCLTDI